MFFASDRGKRIKDSIVNVILALCVLGFLGGGADVVYQQHINANLASQNVSLGKQNLALTKHSIMVSNNHHAQQQVNNAEIQYLVKVVVYQNAELKTSVATVQLATEEHSTTLSDIQDAINGLATLEQQFVTIVAQIPTVKTALVNGQDQLIQELSNISSDLAAIQKEIAAT